MNALDAPTLPIAFPPSELDAAPTPEPDDWWEPDPLAEARDWEAFDASCPACDGRTERCGVCGGAGERRAA